VYGAVGGGVVLLVAAGCLHRWRGAHPHRRKQYHRRPSMRAAAQPRGDGDVAQQTVNPMAAGAAGRGNLRKQGTLKLDSWVKDRNRAHRQNSHIAAKAGARRQLSAADSQEDHLKLEAGSRGAAKSTAKRAAWATARDAKTTMGISGWLRAHAGGKGSKRRPAKRESRVMVRQPSKGDPLPAHLDHGRVETHRKNYHRNHNDEAIKVKGAAGGTDDQWHMAKDPESGDSYFFNETTGAVSWEHPNESAEKSSGAAALERERRMLTNNAAATKKTWEKVTDKESGAPYWWNPETDETRWENPEPDV